MQRTNFMISEIMMAESEQMYITGIVMVCDFTGYTMGHFTQVPMSTMKKLMPCWQVTFKNQTFSTLKIVLIPR